MIALTPRQRQMLALVALGLGNEAIARALGIRLPTVKTTLSEAYRRLGVKNRTQAVVTLMDLERGDDGDR